MLIRSKTCTQRKKINIKYTHLITGSIHNTLLYVIINESIKI
jgi:hypothetical protein